MTRKYKDIILSIPDSLGEGKLPGVFQNLLSEVVMRDRTVAECDCDPHDHFEILGRRRAAHPWKKQPAP